MKIFLIVLAAVVSVAACNDRGEGSSSSVRSVDSATAAAPDTIKPISLDSVARRDTVRRDSGRHGL